MIKDTTTEKLVHVEIVTLNQDIFNQIERPDMTQSTREQWIKTAKENALAIVINKDEQAWLLIQGKAKLWRWSLGNQSNLSIHQGEYPWLDKLPQVYLVKQKKRHG